MNKKVLTLAIGLSLSATAVVGAYVVPENQGISPYSKDTMKIVHESVAQNIAVSALVAPTEQKLDLNETIQLALAHNYDVKGAMAQYEAAKAKISLAQAARNPKLNLGYQYAQSDQEAKATAHIHGGPIDVTTPEFTLPHQKVTRNGGTLTVSLPIYTGGLIEGNISMATYGTEIAKAQLVQKQEETKYNAAKAYFDVLRAKNMDQIAQIAIKDIKAHKKIVDLSYKVGIVAKSDVLSTDVLLANMETNAIKAANAVDLAQGALSRILALPVSTVFAIKDHDFTYTPHDITLEDATAYALMHRPELYQSALAVAVAKKQIEVARAGYKPKIQVSLSDTFGRQSPVPSGQALDGPARDKFLQANPKTAPLVPLNPTVEVQPTGFANSWSVAISASWDLWDGGTTAANVKAAEAAYKAQQEVNKGAVAGISLDVRQAYLNMKEAEGTIESTKTAVTQGEENLRIANLRYSAGVGTNLDVLDAELNLDKSRNAYVEALYNYNLNVAALEKAMGTPVYLPIGQGLDSVNGPAVQKELASLLEDVKKADAQKDKK